MLVERARTLEPTGFAGSSGPDTMQKIAVGLSALVLTPGSASPQHPCHPQLVEAQIRGKAYLAFPDRAQRGVHSSTAHLAGDLVTHGVIPAAMAFPHRLLIEEADHHDRANKGFSGQRRTTQRIGAVYGGNRFSVLRTHLAACVETCDYYQATALYNEVSGISDAELHRRGLSLPSSAKRATEATADCGNRNYDCRHRLVHTCGHPRAYAVVVVFAAREVDG